MEVGVMKRLALAIVLSTAVGAAPAADLCSLNPYTRAEAEQGRTAFDTHCALCHQYNLAGREPGNYLKESPDINLLSEDDLKFVDNSGGVVPPLLGPKFFGKFKGKTLTEFSTLVSGAANTFPTKDFEKPKTYFLLTAYVLARNCGRL
jgi:hypothetical protein